jgi:hypothetical protein
MRRKTKQKDPDLDVESAETLIWACSACGADNPDSRQKCVSCGGDRAGDSAVPKAREPDIEPDVEAQDESDDFEAPEHDTIVSDTIFPEPTKLASEPEEEKPEPLVAEPEISSPIPTPSPSFSPTRPTTGTGKYYLVFVNTPAQSLIKSKAPVEFDDFPVVTIGRSPENVIVIPDPEVSRKHAELTMEGSKLMLKDLNSKNGTYLYNGREFQQVHDSVEVKPNSIVKFGTGTIVRLTGE